MRTTEDFEHALLESVSREAELGTPVYMLLRQLCSVLLPSSVTSPDGVFFVYSRIAEREATAVGIAVMIEQNVEPLRVKFTIGQSGGALSSSWLYLGDTSRKVEYGSREHSKLEKSIIANPEVEFPWKLILQRNDTEWFVAMLANNSLQLTTHVRRHQRASRLPSSTFVLPGYSGVCCS